MILVVLFEPPLDGILVARVGDDGDVRGYGTVRIRDGWPPSILIADGTAQAACADTDGDGVSGLVRLSIGL